jgi:hypothetical protein
MDAEALFVFAAFGLFVSLFAGLVIWSVRKDRAFRASLAEMATEQGWTFTIEAERRGRGAGFTFRDPAQGWTAVFRRPRSRNKSVSSSSGSGSSGFTAPDPGFQGGLLVVSPAQHPGMGSALTQLAGVFDNAFGAKLLGLVLGDTIGRYGGQLQEFPAPEGSGLSVMGTTDPALFFDLAALGPLLRDWHPRSGVVKTPPMVLISDDGLDLRLGYIPRTAEDMRDLILLGQAVRAALQKGARG